MNEFEGRVAVITGGAGVLCSTIAEGLARENARVVLLDIDEKRAEETLARVRVAGSDGLFIKTSVLSRDELNDATRHNFMGTFLASQAVAKVMAEQKGGSIASMNAIRPLTHIPAYSAAKAAVANFTQWLAVHMAQEYSPRIRVNAIAPGFFLTVAAHSRKRDSPRLLPHRAESVLVEGR